MIVAVPSGRAARTSLLPAVTKGSPPTIAEDKRPVANAPMQPALGVSSDDLLEVKLYGPRPEVARRVSD